jgi:hypothetical protein
MHHSDWQPIETAPRDGTPIVVIPYGDVFELQVSWFLDGEERWANWMWSMEPYYWMPLPEPPTEG